MAVSSDSVRSESDSRKRHAATCSRVDVGLLGHGAHLDGVEATLGRERDRGIEDPLAVKPGTLLAIPERF